MDTLPSVGVDRGSKVVPRAYARAGLPFTRSGGLALAITLVATFMGAISVAGATRVGGSLGIAYSFPPSFFVALGLLAIAAMVSWSAQEENRVLNLLQWLILSVALWLAPLHFGDWLPGALHTYDFFGFTDYVLRTGHIAPELEQLWYHNWPGFFILLTALMRIGGVVQPDTLIRLAPFFVQLAYLPGLFVFFRPALGKYSWAGLWLFSLGNWGQHNALLPQAYALILFYVLLAVLTKSGVWQTGGRHQGRYRLVGLLLIGAISVSHVLTATAVVMTLIALWLFRSYRILSFVFLSIVAGIAWTVYGGNQFMQGALPYYLALLGKLADGFVSGFFEAVIQPASAGSDIHQTVVVIRVLLMLLIAAVGSVGFALALRSAGDRSRDWTVASIGAAAASLMLMTGFFTAGVIPRIYAFALPPIAYFGAKTFQRGVTRWVAGTVLVLSMPLAVAAHEGNQVIDFVPRGYVDALVFFHGHSTGGSVVEPRVLEGDPPPFGGFRNRESYFVARYRWPHWEGVLDAISAGRIGVPPSYVVMSPSLDDVVTQYLTADSSIVETVNNALGRSQASRCYDNGVVTISFIEP